jgi:hypothetical protein
MIFPYHDTRSVFRLHSPFSSYVFEENIGLAGKFNICNAPALGATIFGSIKVQTIIPTNEIL